MLSSGVAHGVNPEAERIACTHCGDPVPPALVRAGAAAHFCCDGCRTVHGILADAGLERYYELRRRTATAAAGRPTGRGYAAFDDPALVAQLVTTEADGTASVALLLENVHCAACLWLVERLPRVEPAVLEARLDLSRRVVRVRWDPARLSLAGVARALDAIGYPAHPWRAAERDRARVAELRRDLVDIAVAGACAGNVMVAAFALYGGMRQGMDPGVRLLLHLLSFALTVFAVAVPGRHFFRHALAAVRTRTAHMDLPVAIALAVGTLGGGAFALLGTDEVYFESITAIVFLLLVGRAVQRAAHRRAQAAVEGLYRVAPIEARRVEDDGTVVPVAVDALLPGDRIEIRGGEIAPADGTVESGHGAFDRAIVTGESAPMPAPPGAAVLAGSCNLGGAVVLRVASVGADTRAGRLLALVERLAHERTGVVALADRLAHRFVLGAMALALLAAALGARAGGAGEALERAITVLIVTCPCALGLATPVAVVAAVGRAARRGILVKGGGALEPLARPGTMLLDKTGTVTRGGVRLVAWTGDDGVRALVGAIERQVDHPLAAALAEALSPDGAPAVHAVRTVPGAGVEAETDAGRVRIGAPAWAADGLPTPAWADEAVHDAATRAGTPVVVRIDDRVAAVAMLADALQPDAAAHLDALRARGWRVRLVSGDHPGAVAAVGAALGIAPEDCLGRMSPEAKAALVRETRAAAPDAVVAMVGDGVNDAAAHAAATVGIAVHGAADASLQAADAHLGRPGLGSLVELTDGARAVHRTIRLGLAASLAYNALAGALAVAGWIDPIVAAVLMPCSSLTVVAIAWWGRAFRGADGPADASVGAPPPPAAAPAALPLLR